ncbi:MAG: hypothetical protein HOV81_38020 [Kofleriaceae bacterium]|nr:hypothetical protein [Kofleriaceae bacterium]
MRALVIVLVLGLARIAHAGWEDLEGGAQLHYELSGEHGLDRKDTTPGMLEPPRELALWTARLHGFVGGKTFAFHVGLDLGAGGSIRGGGFAYDVSLFPFGVAVRFFETSFITFGAGIGASGATGTLDDAATMPLELRFELGRGIRVLGRARATFVAAAKARDDGARFADELEAMLALRLGTGYDEYGFPTGNGYFIGATYRELMDTQFVGAVFGYSIDMGTRRKPRPVLDNMEVPGCPRCR